MVNLIGNPLMNDFKSIGVLPKTIIVEHADLYVVLYLLLVIFIIYTIQRYCILGTSKRF